MVRLTDRPDMNLDVYCGRKTTTHTLYLRVVSCCYNLNEDLHRVNFKSSKF